jgi:hypothetical protein
MEVLGSRGLLAPPLLGALLHFLLLALAGGAEAWAHHGSGGFAGGVPERRYRDLAAGRVASVRSSFGAARRGLATVSTYMHASSIWTNLSASNHLYFQIKTRAVGVIMWCFHP